MGVACYKCNLPINDELIFFREVEIIVWEGQVVAFCKACTERRKKELRDRLRDLLVDI